MSCFFVLSLYDLSNADVIVRVSAKCTLVTIQISDMKKILFGVMAIVGLCLSTVTLQSCDDGETYAEMKDKEKNAIRRFLKDNDLIGPISVISESKFYEQDSLTDTTKNEFVLFADDGVYMQIVRKGEGQSMVEMAKGQADSTVTKVLLCRFMEYDIESADTTYTNYYVPAIVDKMQCRYVHRGRSYTASFTDGYMKMYHGGVVPTGWLKPLDYIRLSKNAGKIAKVRLIVPHSSGTSNATQYVLPFYYEITFQLGR